MVFRDRLAGNLENVYRRYQITPVIVESHHDRFEEVATRLRDLIPRRYLIPQTGFRPVLSRLTDLVEFPFSTLKKICAFNMFSIPLYRDRIDEVAQWREVKKIYLNRIMRALQTLPPEEAFTDSLTNQIFTTTKYTKKLIGCDRLNQEGYTGKQATVAVIDTGARPTHPQLLGVTTTSAMREKGGSGLDSNGHGTWCVSCVGGRSVTDPTFNLPVEGMAPYSQLLSIQALGFVVGIGTTDDVIEAMEMAMNAKANIVSLSLGSNDAPPPEDNPEKVAIDMLIEKGIICCVAAGNAGPDPSTVGSPGCCENALTVGALDQFTGEVASFSSRGPIHGLIKPDVVAPGVNIYSGCTGLLDALADKREQRYSYLSGTSMATPHVSGFLACVYQLFKEKYGVALTTELVKDIASKYGNEKNNDSGWGLIRGDWFFRYADEELK